MKPHALINQTKGLRIKIKIANNNNNNNNDEQIYLVNYYFH